MAAELQVTPKIKPRLSPPQVLSENKCVFCGQEFSKTDKAVTGDVTKLEKVVDACKSRRDAVSGTILRHEADLRNGSQKLVYHRNCRATFISPDHISRGKKQPSSSEDVDANPRSTGKGEIPTERTT